jgi:TonB-linked SusC/RagA family outer membrane protein
MHLVTLCKDGPIIRGSVIKQFLLFMKLTAILLLAAALQVSAKGLSQNVTLNYKNVPVKKVFKEIIRQTGVSMIYKEAEIDRLGKVSISVKDAPLTEALKICFKNEPYKFQLVNNTVVISPDAIVLNSNETKIPPASSIKITGKVSTETGEPLVGVSVVVKGTTKGTSTIADGSFSIDANVGDVLEFSMVGYQKRSVTVKNNQPINIQMQIEVTAGSEIVVVGYGTQKKVNLSGAVASVSGKDLANRPITNINQGLEGLVANLNVSPSNGRATTAPDFNIRGFTSINGGSAFILVDNVPATSQEVARLNPADIASVSVLKDAASAAIYGARAAFGVVLITTKTAKSDKLIISANANYAIRNIGSVPDLVTDPLQVMQIKHDAATPLYDLYPDAVRVYAAQRSKDPSLPAVIVDPTNPNAWAYYGSTNWMKEAYNNTAPAYTADVSIAKRDKKLSYYLSGGYYRQDGLLRYGNDVLNRYNLRTNATYQLTDWLKIGTTSAYTYSTYSSPNFIDGLFFWDVNRTPSLSVPKNPDGTWTSDGAAILGTLQQGGRKSTSTNDMLTTLNTEISLVKDAWVIKGDATFRRTNTPTQSYNLPVPYTLGPGQPVGYRFADGSGGNAYAQNEAYIANQNVFNIYTDFHKTFGTKHFLQALAGFNQEYRYWNDFTVRRNGLITNSLPTPQLATGTITQTNTIAEWAVRGLFYRLNYIYDDKYIVEFDGREDGSSHFPANDRWGFFPSASGAWVISKENFFDPIAKSIKMNLFKIRGSYGMLGNQVTNTDPSLNNYPYIPTMSSGPIGQILDGALPIAVYQPGVVSPTLTWEKVSTLNGGVDVAFLDNRLEVSYDRYTRYTDDMLTKSKTLPGVFGASEPKTNAANLKTQGWELTASYRDEFKAGNSPLHYSLRFTLANSKSYITKYDNPNKLLSNSPNGTPNYYVGQRIGEIWGFFNDGVFQSADDVANSPDQTAVGEDDQNYKWYQGDVKFKDLNKDNKIDFGDNTVANPGDRKIIGNNTPQLPYSFDVSGDWKGFDVRVFIQGIGKRDWYPGPSNIYFWGVYAQPWTNVTVQNLNHWTPDNPNAYFPALRAYIAEDQVSPLTIPQTKYLQNAAYMRVKNITVGYSLPQSLMRKWKLNQIRFYVSGENLFTVDHLKVNMDPEAILSGSGQGSDIYPFQKIYSFGVNLNF